MHAPLKYSILLASVMSISAMGNAQSGSEAHVRMADKYFKEMSYALAIPEYKAAADQGAINEHVTGRLAECYMRTGDTESAERWYSTAVKFLIRDPNVFYLYAEALKANGKYEAAEEQMDKFYKLTDPNSIERSNISVFARKFALDKDRFTVRPAKINTTYSDFGVAIVNANKVFFASSRNEKIGIQRKAGWNDQPFLDIYEADRSSSGEITNARLLEGPVNSKLHEGPVSCSRDGKTMYFTRNDLFKGRSQKGRNGINHLNIYSAQWDGREWKALEKFKYNNSECSVGHPALAPNGDRLYFVSDMPGGYGGSDIYVCRDLGGLWSEPENLGPGLNTEYDELFPSVGPDGTLYFSSNGHPGLGGLDIFASPMIGAGNYEVALNLGAPVNSPKDDLAFIMDATGRSGYFSSNRPGGLGDDDIYLFEMHRPLEENFLCTGVVFDDVTDLPMQGAEVLLVDADGREVDRTNTDGEGKYSLPILKDKEYKVVARAPGHFDAEQHLSTENVDKLQIISRELHLPADAGIWVRGTARMKGRMGFVEGMTVTVVNLTSFFSESEKTGPGGDFRFRLQNNEQFEVLLEKKGYFSMTVPVSTSGMREGVIDLNQIRDLSFEPVELGKPIRLMHVRWALGSSDLDAIARTELDLLAERLMVNPAMRVEVGVHEDARGDARQSLKITQARADAIVKHLSGKGISKTRLTGKGYGSSELLNHCATGVECTEEQHAENRRVEYTVIGYLQ